MNPLNKVRKVGIFGPGISVPTQSSADGRIRVWTPRGQKSRVKIVEPKGQGTVKSKVFAVTTGKSAYALRALGKR